MANILNTPYAQAPNARMLEAFGIEADDARLRYAHRPQGSPLRGLAAIPGVLAEGGPFPRGARLFRPRSSGFI